ncbi:MAG: hypothetical protein RLZZ04_4760 [Cyanobacteriota bacterium]|jgi:ABC-2 type transport system permease protein
MNILKWFSNSRLLALTIKETNQILRDQSLLFFVVFSTTFSFLVYGFALNPDIQNLKLGVVDYAKTYQSRELISAFTENNIFIPEMYSLNERQLGEQVRKGKLTVGLVIPSSFSRQLAENKNSEVQVFIDGVDANTAGIANGYINQIIQQYNDQLIGSHEVCTECNQNSILIRPQTVFLYNPALVSSWFFVPGVMGIIYTLISLINSVGTVIREKDQGTLEQLLMTPAETWEILLAKILPLFVLLMCSVTVPLFLGRVIFHIPFRGSFLLFYLLSALYIFVGIGTGMILATIARTQTQALLISFFITLPMIQLSGALAPVESMPALMRYLSIFDPLTHYVAIVRGIMLRGVGLEGLWQNSIALLGFAVIILSISINRFRRQLK